MLECSCNLFVCADHQYVAEYRLDVLGGPEGNLFCFGMKHDQEAPPSLASNATFPDKVCTCMEAYLFTCTRPVSSLVLLSEEQKETQLTMSGWCERHPWQCICITS